MKHFILDASDHYTCYPPQDAEASIAPHEWWLHVDKAPKNPETITGATALIWRSIAANRHVLISGAGGGSGKSYVAQEFIAQCQTNPKINLVVTSPTAVSALLIGGTTLHRALGLGVPRESSADLWKKMCAASSRYSKTFRFLERTDVLILDEISMVHYDFFALVLDLFRRARGATRGLPSLVMVGDFLQLGSIIKPEDPQIYNDDGQLISSVFQTRAFEALAISRIWLNRCFRQDEGPFLTALHNIRFGRVTAADVRLLRSRIVGKRQKNPDDLLEPLDIFSYRKSVEEHNNAKLKALVSADCKSFSFDPEARVGPRLGRNDYDAHDAKEALALINDKAKLKDTFLVYDVSMCIGAQVMCRCNAYVDRGVANGTLGVVLDYSPSAIDVRFKTAGGEMVDVKVTRFEFRAPIRSCDVILTQFPLMLAWAATIHAVQGCTLDSVRIGAKSFFAPGQFYVALSRVRKLEDLSLVAFDASWVMADPQAIAFETMPGTESASAAENEEESSDSEDEDLKRKRVDDSDDE